MNHLPVTNHSTNDEIRETSDEVNYAKQTQFWTKSSFYNPSFNSGLQRKNEIGHLVKTNPNKANSRSVKNEINPLYDKGI